MLGPGFITANVDNDAGGIYTYSQAGAQFGYSLLWTMIPITLALIVVQEMCARMGAVTGKGLSDLIREEFGLRITFLMMSAPDHNFGNVVAEFIGIASSLELFHVSQVHLACRLRRVRVAAGGEGRLQERGKGVSGRVVFYIAYIIAGVLAEPAWHEALMATVKPPHAAGWSDKTLYLHGDWRGGHDDCALDAVLSAIVGGGEGDHDRSTRPRGWT